MMSPFKDGTELLAEVLAMDPPASEAGALHAALIEAARRPDDDGLRRRIAELAARMPARLKVVQPGDDVRPGMLGEIARRLAASGSLAPAAGNPAAIAAFLERADDDPILLTMCVTESHSNARSALAAGLKALAEAPRSADAKANLRRTVSEAEPLLEPPFPGVYHGRTFLRFARFVLGEA